MRVASLGLALLAVSMSAGLAEAGDDCAAAGPGTLCLLDDHDRHASGSSGPYAWSEHDWSNDPAVFATDAGPAGTTWAGLRQREYVFEGCQGSCWSYAFWYSSLSVYQDAGATSGSADAGQWGTADRASYRDAQWTSTYVYAERNVGERRYNAGVSQDEFRYNQYQSCDWTAQYTLGGEDQFVPLAPCVVGTPAGPVDTYVPSLLHACVPEAGLCGRMPDWPDATGLPFL